MRVLYEGGLISKRKYTSIRNSSDVVKETGKKRKNVKTEFMTGCEVPKILPYKTLMAFIRSIDIENLAAKYCVEAFPGVYGPLKSFLLKLINLYLVIDSKSPCLHWLNREKEVLYVAVGADGDPFRKDNTATAYLVSLLNILNRVQSCHDNHLLMGSNCAEDTQLMKNFDSEHLMREMEEIGGKKLTTAQGNQVDLLWVSCIAASYPGQFALFELHPSYSARPGKKWQKVSDLREKSPRNFSTKILRFLRRSRNISGI